MQTARDIYQAWLDRVAEMLWVRDHAGVARAMHYPHDMRTRDGIVHFDGPARMVEAAGAFRDYLERMGAQAYFRLCDAAEMVEDGRRIDGRHRTFILRGGTYVVAPFSNDMTLVHKDGEWLGAGIRADVGNNICTILSPAHLRQQAQAGHVGKAKEDRTR